MVARNTGVPQADVAVRRATDHDQRFERKECFQGDGAALFAPGRHFGAGEANRHVAVRRRVLRATEWPEDDRTADRTDPPPWWGNGTGGRLSSFGIVSSSVAEYDSVVIYLFPSPMSTRTVGNGFRAKDARDE